jgi:hypothetical protein
MTVGDGSEQSWGFELSPGRILSERMARRHQQYRSARSTGWAEYQATEGKHTGTVRARIYRDTVSKDAAEEYGAPIGAELIIYLETYPNWPGREDIEAEIVGYGSPVRVEGVSLRTHGQNGLLPPYVVVLRQTAWKTGTIGYGEIKWLNGGRYSVCQYGEADPNLPITHLEGAHEALRFVTRIRTEERGRPRRYTAETEPLFFEDLKTAAHAAIRAGEKHVNYATLARHGLASEPTVKAAVKLFRYDLKAIEAEAAHCTQRANLCTFYWRDRAKFKKKQG